MSNCLHIPTNYVRRTTSIHEKGAIGAVFYEVNDNTREPGVETFKQVSHMQPVDCIQIQEFRALTYLFGSTV